MRELFKHILKASGTPVLQMRQGTEETILSAGNIWTSAHARRIELSDRGLAPGAVLCSETGGFQAVIDFVACAIGGFVYLPVTRNWRRMLQRQLAVKPVASRTGIAFGTQAKTWRHHRNELPAGLAAIQNQCGAQLIFCQAPLGSSSRLSIFTSSAIEAWVDRLSVRLETPEGGTRLSYCAAHHHPAFVTDLLLGICNRQTIYLREGAQANSPEMLSEILELEVDDLVLAPRMLEGLSREVQLLGGADRKALEHVRCHLSGPALSPRRLKQARQMFVNVFAETAE